MDERVEIRCPGRYRKLFFVLIRDYLPRKGMLMEVACYDCARDRRKHGEPIVSMFHYFDSAGDYVESKKILDLSGEESDRDL